MKPLVILDIDETLIHSEYNSEPEWFDFSFEKESNGEIATFYVQKRPFLTQFIGYVKSEFDIAIWTAASYGYAKEIIKNIGIEENNLTFFYHKEMCTLVYDPEMQNYYGIKNLKKIRNIRPLEKVLIIDDITETAQNNYGNLIKIKPFEGNENDVELLKLISYLEKIKGEPNFRRIEKRGWDYEK